MNQARLPATLQLIADAIGLAAALELCRAFGGTSVYLPEKPRPDNPVAAAIGVEAATDLAEKIGAGALMVPLGPEANARRIREGIARELDGGQYSHQQIARRFRCHVRTVERVAARMDGRTGDPRQPSLFGSKAE